MCHEGVRIERDRAPVLGNGVIVSAESAEDVAKIVPRTGTVRAQRDGALGMRQRFRQAADVLQQRRKMGMRIREISSSAS
jgi:hypothetical protein